MSTDGTRNPFIDPRRSSNTEIGPDPTTEDPDDIPAAMTESYSEIAYTQNFFGTESGANGGGGDEDSANPADASGFSSSSSSQTRKRPDSLDCDKRKDASFPYNLEGTVRVDGNMTHFVAENLEYKIKLASPVTVTRKDSTNSRQSTPSAATGGTSAGGSYGLLPKPFMVPPHLNQIDANALNEIEREAQLLAASVDNLTESLCSVLHSISSITADNVEIYKNSVTKLTDCMDANIKCMYTIMAKAEEISKAIKPAEALATRIREIKRLVDMFESNV